ncbi:DUF1793-domain-containing protein [Hortaea werneckii]|nr:DUF1793-domain-containing protein [Hortaea werneckii]
MSRAAPTFSPILPPPYPLAVKNPYLSAWLPGDQAADLAAAIPQFWTGQDITWSILARVDGTLYSLFGAPPQSSGVKPAITNSADYTSTYTTFGLTAGDAEITLDFMTPVSPTNYVRQSLPMSYLTVSVSHDAETTPSVQVYTDIDNSWISPPNTDTPTNWTYALSAADTHILTLTAQDQLEYSEVKDVAQWGTLAYCTRPSASNVTAKAGPMSDMHVEFGTAGSLNGDSECGPGSVIALSHDLGQLDDQKNVTFAIGQWRQPVVNYLGNDRASYFASQCQGVECACVHALTDFEAADAEARALDAQIADKAVRVVGQNYSDIVTLSVRQAFAALEVTIPADTLDTSDVLAFVKEISSNGNVNTVDVIYPISPIFYVLAPEYIRITLEPMLRYLGTGRWPLNYTLHDLGSHYPNATGHDDGIAEPMPVEECGNLLILICMYEKATGKTDLRFTYSILLQQYAEYLVENGLYPSSQLSTDDGAGEEANQTSLAIKAAIALNAYGVMTGQRSFSDTGRHFAQVLYDERVGVDANQTHFLLVHNDEDSWALQFNLYVDVLLDLRTFSTAALRMQTEFYVTEHDEAGVALDNRVNWSKTDWMLFAAATAMAPDVENEGIRDMFIDDIHGFITNGKNDVPFGDRDPFPPAEAERTTTRYVEVTTDTTFTITLKADKALHFLGNGLAVNIYMDGNLVDALLIKREDVKTSVMGQTYSSEALHSAVDEVQRFRFADLRSVVAEEISVGEGGGRPLLQRGLGTIRIEVSHCNVGGEAEFEAPESSAVGGEIEEGKLKGQAISNSVSFMEAVKGATFDYYSSSLIPDQPSPFAVYVFKYRSLEDLRNLHILPRPASPEPLERRDPDTLSAVEIVELQQALAAARADSVKIKREMVENGERPRKRARQMGGTEQSEVDEDGVRPIGMRLPAISQKSL